MYIRNIKMCIIFWYAGGGLYENYKMVIAANRDEFYWRPAAPAHFWTDHPHVLAGQDLTKGKEGGSWLGVTKYGHIAAITNLRLPTENPDAESRGPLVRNFLTMNSNPISYANLVNKDKAKYNGFCLTLGRVSSVGSSCFHYLDNGKDSDVQELKGIHQITNGGLDRTWSKGTKGARKFETILKSHKNKEDLVTQMLNLLQDETRYNPQESGSGEYITDENLALQLSSIFVKVPENHYGTRTNTVILIDKSNHLTFVERTMMEPMNLDNPNWKTTKFEFELEDETAAHY